MSKSKKNDRKIKKQGNQHTIALPLHSHCTLGWLSCRILDVLHHHQIGVPSSYIYDQLKHHSISRRSLYWNLNYLVEHKLLIKESLLFSINRSAMVQTQGSKWRFTTQQKQIELHNISFVVSIKNTPIWWENRHEMLFKYKLGTIEEVKWGNNKYQKIDAKDFIIQVFQNSLVFISKVRYHAPDPYECFTKAVDNYLRAYKDFEEILRFQFNYDEAPTVKVKSSHYVMINDAIAKHCKKTGDKFAVEIDGSVRVWVDMSEPLGMEAGDPDHALGDIAQYQEFVKDLLLHPDLPKYSQMVSMFFGQMKMQNEFMASQIPFFETQKEYAENLKTHIFSIKELARQVNLFGSQVKDQNKINEEHHEVIKEVKKLLNKANISLGQGDSQ